MVSLSNHLEFRASDLGFFVSAFGAITDNYFIPFMEGVKTDSQNNHISVSVLAVNSLGVVECWQMSFSCRQGVQHTARRMMSPKAALEQLRERELATAVEDMLNDEQRLRRFRIFFNNEYYPALIPIRDKVVLLHRAVEGLIARGALNEKDREIIRVTEHLAGDWLTPSD